MSEHDSPGYDGPARLLAGEAEGAREIGVHVVLRGVFQPIDGRYHWYGRVQHDTSLEETVRPGATVMLRTPFGEAAGKLSDRDPWGRYRVSGTGRPPFPTT